MMILGEDFCELLRCADPNQTQVSILNLFVGEALPVRSGCQYAWRVLDRVVAPMLHSMQALMSL
jgi:hypothetical protein